MMIAIKKIGGVLSTDWDGFIISESSLDKIVSPWSEPVNEIKKNYLKQYAHRVHSIYIRGSVSKGGAIEGISDIDSLAVVQGDLKSIDRSWITAFEASMKQRYPFISGVEIELIPYEELIDITNPKHLWKRLVIKTQSACIYGEDLAPAFPGFKPGSDCKGHADNLEREIDLLMNKLDELDLPQTKAKCTWIMKRILRTGYELVMEREQAYTRDLYPCYEGFIKYYPEKEKDMYKALNLTLNPISTKRELCDFLKSFGVWVCGEVDAKLR